jgi:AraC-like DNA-binding protein
MVKPVQQDARGIVTPDAGLARFTLDRFAPSPGLGRLVDRFWVVRWDLRGQPAHTQHVLAHPVVNLTFLGGGPGVVTGVTTRVTAQSLEGAGRVLGVMFRPAGFRPLLGRPLTTITDRRLPLAEVVDPALANTIAERVASAADSEGMAEVADSLLGPLVPPTPGAYEATATLVEKVAADPAFTRVEHLAEEARCTVRQLQRRFGDHVGLSPGAVIRRYRLYEAAERARGGRPVDWAAVATDLGYADQPHLTRDFTTQFGLPPGRYVALNRPAEPPAGEPREP